MAEEDEIDVLGDFSLNDSCLTLVSENAELLNCDYTIHPQWLLDKPSANPDNWYQTGSEIQENNESESLGHVSTENCITDESGWTEKEKNLLERGIEIFGKSNVRLSQFIGSKTASEVKYYLKNFYTENQGSYRTYSECLVEDNNLVSDVLDDTQIPASIEEVIAAVSTAKSTVPLSGKKVRKKSNSFTNDSYNMDINEIPSGHSVLKSNYSKENKLKKSDLSKMKQKNKGKKSVKFKFKTKLKIPLFPKEKVKKVREQVRQKTVKFMNECSKKTEITKVEITTGVGLSVPICEGEEIIKLKKVENESDEDVDIDIEDNDDNYELKPKLTKKVEIKEPMKPETTDQNIKKESIIEECDKESPNSLHNNQFVDLSVYNDKTVKQLMSLEEPTEEFLLNDNVIIELEKAVVSEFFEGRGSKTPERYLKIRNHILNAWRTNKPTYVTKTLVRAGLKSCGDVNIIGRIHYFLEQIGAINFGCSQMCYSRPLYDLMQTSVPLRQKITKDCPKQVSRNTGELGSRPRMKKKFANDGEGGCTLTHDENGEIINTTIVNEEPVVKQRLYIKKPMVRLIYCRPFNDEKPQEYTVNIHLSALLKMDLHAHTNLSEVMGLVAGYWNPHNKTLTITHYETCKNMASSSTHCDMCPISQAKASEIIHAKGLDILGWFHSHPTFAPEPSQQDLETQQAVQRWIGARKPCIGVILSPFSLNGALIASPYRCMIVDKKLNFEDQFVPYKFHVGIMSEDFVVKDFLKEVQRVMFGVKDAPIESRVRMNKPYFQDVSITFLDKVSFVKLLVFKVVQFISADNLLKNNITYYTIG
ncbi:unnamed protein product [Brassicogethes aeneus]|uniref:Myb-like, SWIRM and MPN domain-containing protein 1 n=1 Tax=Brassicogethes aeneus TaxID=1431903 RepID=A0A9P0B5D5_BRAAE|nr:unnamed protein product [Brassicogethes aeneus]